MKKTYKIFGFIFQLTIIISIICTVLFGVLDNKTATILFAKIFIICAILLFLLLFLSSITKNVTFHKFLCYAFGWHEPDSHINFDGLSLNSKCKYCKEHILQCTNGDWFAKEEL